MFWAFLSDWEEIIDQIQFEFVAFSIYGKSGRTIELVFTDSTMMTFFIFNGKEPWNIQFRYDLAAKGYTEIILSAIRVDGTIQDISRKSLITS